ncbi:MAG: hypothetical protein J6D21_01550 [Clostridia bacterium]|nr:hypothetical protein [Clostridia bacterium]
MKITMERTIIDETLELTTNNTLDAILDAIKFIIDNGKYTIEEIKIIENVIHSNQLDLLIVDTLKKIKTELELAGAKTDNIIL